MTIINLGGGKGLSYGSGSGFGLQSTVTNSGGGGLTYVRLTPYGDPV